MFEKIIRFAIEQRWLVLLCVLGLAALGIYNYQRLPIDAVPDITNVQVQINTQATGYSPLESEQRVTLPVETAMLGLPNLEQTRSISRYGLSQVTVVFKEGTDIYFARQLVNERLQEARSKLPSDLTPTLGPITTGLGEIYMWTIEAKAGALKADQTPYSATDLREIQDWIIKPQLRNVKGVTEVNTIGGFSKTYLIAPNPARLIAYGLSFNDVVLAVERNNASVGAGYIERRGEQYLVRAPAQVSNLSEIADIVISTTSQGIPILVRDVARVEIGHELRTGAATENGEEVVLGTVFMLLGENSRAVSQAVDEKLKEISRNLPEGVKIQTVYDRTLLIDKAIATVKKNLIEGALLVIAILFLFLGNLRAALITAAVIPLAMLMTFSGMVSNKVSANLMSLGALDFGIIIDGAVVIVENCIRRLAHAQKKAQEKWGRTLTRKERFDEVFEAAREARRPLIYGQLIIMVVYVPIFALTGVEGKMFHPMALTVVMALFSAMILSMTFIPAAVALLMGNRVDEKENRLMLWAKKIYEPILDWALLWHNRALVLSIALVMLVLSGLLASKMGSEFVPSLNEGDVALHAMRIPGTSLTQAIEMQTELEHALMKAPEVKRVFAKLGTAEIASDPMPPNVADTFVMLKPRNEWPNPNKSKETLVSELEAIAEKVPGSNYEFTQPIQMRFNELISGVRSDVAIKIFGDNREIMEKTAQEIAEVLENVSGASDVKIEQTTGLPVLTVQMDRAKLARLGLNVSEIQDILATSVGGREAGAVFQGDRRFDIVVRLPESIRSDLEALKRLPVKLPKSENANNPNLNDIKIDSTLSAPALSSAAYVQLGDIARFDLSPGPNQISRENGKRSVVVTANVRGRDIGSFVKEAQAQLNEKIKIEAGYWLTWGGTFEQLQSAAKRLQIVIPLALMLVFMLLFSMFNNLKDGLLVFTGVPFALTGGIVALWLRDIPLSISAGVGFIALSGVAVLNGLVMISFIRSLQTENTKMPVHEAVREGALTRLRPVLMTALVASLGFIPMAIATGTGAEVQRPLATVVIGGILSSTFLTLLVLPMLYQWVHKKDDLKTG